MAIGILKRMLFSAPLVATAYFACSTHLLAETARVLGRDEEALEYKTLHQRIKDAYQATFIGRDGQMHSDKQASYVRALAFDLVPPTLQRAAVDHLVRLIQENDDHPGTGFLSTPFLCHVLSEHGQLEVAYALLKQDTIPSWLYQVVAGIEPGAPGYKHIRFRRRPGGGLAAASARYHSLYGRLPPVGRYGMEHSRSPLRYLRTPPQPSSYQEQRSDR